MKNMNVDNSNNSKDSGDSKFLVESFRGTRWLITGGTSGLGLALVRELVAADARVAVVARGKERLRDWARRIPFVPIAADLSEKDDIHRISGQALGQLGGIDVLVNGASALGPTPLRSLLDTECEDFARVLETNLLGPFRLSRAVLPSMLLQGRGAIVNISSDAAVSAYPSWGAYGTSKAALDHLTRIWNEELGPRGIRFFSIDPGDMDTPMHAAAIPDADPATLKRPETSARQLLEFLATTITGSSQQPGAVRRSL